MKRPPSRGDTPRLLTGLAPLADARTRLLVLGSFPGGASLASSQYYAHPQNQFWKIWRTLFPAALPGAAAGDPYEARCEWLLGLGVGVWDVYAACEREGSLDANIRNAQVNDFSLLPRLCPCLAVVAHNGGESHRHARHTAALGVPVLRLPSTSPANASWSFARKLEAWRAAAEAAGLLGPPPPRGPAV